MAGRAAVEPEGLTTSFATAINARDLRPASALFTRGGCLLTPDATAVRGRSEIRAILAQMIGQGVWVEIRESWVMTAGEVAFGRERWHMRSAGLDGEVFEQASSASAILQLVEGTWKLAILAPWGWGSDLPEVRWARLPESG